MKRLKLVLVVVCVVLSCFFGLIGCRIAGFYDPSNSGETVPEMTNSLFGTVVADVPNAQIQASILTQTASGVKVISNAEVWLDDLLYFPHQFTGASGSYVFVNVSAGTHRVVASYTDNSGSPYKARSLLEVLNSSEHKQVEQLILVPASKIVSGVLRDPQGNPLASGTRLIIWGETVTVSNGGHFISPPLPEDASNVEVRFVESDEGTGTIGEPKTPLPQGIDFTLPIRYVDQPLDIDVTIPTSAAISTETSPIMRNRPPEVGFLAKSSAVATTSVGAGDQLTLIGSVTDPDEADRNKLVTSWSASGGQVSVDPLNPLVATFTAGSLEGSATVSLTAYDPQGATSAAILRINILANTVAPTPGAGGALTFTNVVSTDLTVSWTTATDDHTPVTSLEYKLVKASAVGDIDTISKADAVSGADVLVGWEDNTTTKNVGNLTADTTYWFAVLVRDASGNKAMYQPAAQTTTSVLPLADTTSPAVGTDLIFSNISSQTLTMSWGSASDDKSATANLQYLVFRSGSNNLNTVSNAFTNGTGVGTWTANVTSVDVAGLTQNTHYWFVVVVKDEAGNQAIYTQKTVETIDSQVPVPGNSGSITFANVASQTLTVTWTAGTDNKTGAANLQYLVFRSGSNNLDTVSNAFSNGTGVGTWTANVTSVDGTGLTQNTHYWFVVVVKDEAGNQAIYTQKTVETIDSQVPVPGNSGAISFANIASQSLTVNWSAGTDNKTGAANLQYLVFRSGSNNLDTVSNAFSNGTGVGTWTANVTSVDVTGLTLNTQYWFVVVVKDEAGNLAIYTQDSAETIDSQAPVPGNGGNLAFSDVKAKTMTITWTAATDDVTVQNQLSYKLVTAVDGSSINSVEKADAVTGSDVLMDWAVNSTTFSPSALTPISTYWFSVVVKDGAGNKALYGPLSQETLSQTVSTFAGDGTAAELDGNRLSAQFNAPYGLTIAPNGDIFVADPGAGTIRKIVGDTVSTLRAGLGHPRSVIRHPLTGNIWVTAESANKVYEINPTSGLDVHTYNAPGCNGLAVDASGNVYFSQFVVFTYQRIYKIDNDGNLTLFAGSTIGSTDGDRLTTATFGQWIYGMACDSEGNVYVADSANNKIRKIDINTGVVSTIAGSGANTSLDNPNGLLATFKLPVGICLDSSNNIFVAEYWGNKIRRIDPSGAVTTFAGTGTAGHVDGDVLTAEFNNPYSVGFDFQGRLFVSDSTSNYIRMIQ